MIRTYWFFPRQAICAVLSLVMLATLPGFGFGAEPIEVFAQRQQQLAQNEQKQSATPQRPKVAVPSDEALLLLIRASLIALNQANVTGNYSVLRDLSAPNFKETNSLDRLAEIFARMRQRRVDLSPTLLMTPKLYRQAAITPKGMLRITGFFPMPNSRIDFDLIFQSVEGRWRLLGISADAKGPQQVPGAQAAPENAGPSETAATKKPPPPAPKPKTSASTSTGTKKSSTDGVDIRDRLEAPASPPPEEEPKEKSWWNPFDR